MGAFPSHDSQSKHIIELYIYYIAYSPRDFTTKSINKKGPSNGTWLLDKTYSNTQIITSSTQHFHVGKATTNLWPSRIGFYTKYLRSKVLLLNEIDTRTEIIVRYTKAYYDTTATTELAHFSTAQTQSQGKRKPIHFKAGSFGWTHHPTLFKLLLLLLLFLL